MKGSTFPDNFRSTVGPHAAPSVASQAIDLGPAPTRLTRLMARTVNGLQLAAAEVYIHGLEIPDSLFRATIHATMPTLFRHFPALLAPCEWVLRESDQLADSSGELMKTEYNLPLEMMRRILGDGPLIYPKFSVGLWENGARDLEESQIHMIDQIIERLGIEDGDHVLDLGCGWGCVANYLLSCFPNLRMTGLNLSSEQCGYIRGKMVGPGSFLSSGRFTLVEADLNAMAFSEQFDKVLSIGLFKHVGKLTQALQARLFHQA